MAAKRHLTWKDLSMEFVAGLFFFGAMIILAVFTIILSRENVFSKRLTRDVLFKEVSGLSEGDNVLLHGVTVGRVYTLALDGDNVRVRLNLRQPLRLYNDYLVEIRYSSVLGGRHVAVVGGTPEKGVLPDTGDLVGSTPPDLVNEAGRLVQSIKIEIDKIRETLDREKTLEKITKFVDDMSVISGDLRAGKGTLGKLLQDDALYAKANDTMQSVTDAGEGVKAAADNIYGMVGDLRGGKGTVGKLLTDDTVYNDVQSMVADLRAGKGTLGRLLVDDKLYSDLQAISTDFRQVSHQLASGESTLGRLIMDKGEVYLSLKNTLDATSEFAEALRSGKGTLGKLAMDPTLYEDTRKTVQEVRGAVQDFREQAPVSTFGGMLFGAF